MTNDELTSVEDAMAEAEKLLEGEDQKRRLMDTLLASNAAASHVRVVYSALCGANEYGLPAVPEGLAHWHMVQVWARALAAWRGEAT